MSGLPFLAIWLGKFHNLLIMHVFRVVWCSAASATHDVAENGFDKDVETISRNIHYDFTFKSVRIVLHSTNRFSIKKLRMKKEDVLISLSDATKCKMLEFSHAYNKKQAGFQKSNRLIGLAIFCTFSSFKFQITISILSLNCTEIGKYIGNCVISTHNV